MSDFNTMQQLLWRKWNKASSPRMCNGTQQWAALSTVSRTGLVRSWFVNKAIKTRWHHCSHNAKPELKKKSGHLLTILNPNSKAWNKVNGKTTFTAAKNWKGKRERERNHSFKKLKILTELNCGDQKMEKHCPVHFLANAPNFQNQSKYVHVEEQRPWVTSASYIISP